MKDNRSRSFDLVKQDEGLRVKSDRDTLTVYGLTATDIWNALGRHFLPGDLGEFPGDQATEVYEYLWEKYSLDRLPSGLDYFMFDCGLVCGFPASYRWLGMSLLSVGTERNIAEYAEIARDLSPERTALLISQIGFSRRRRHKAQPGWRTYGQQWTNRVNRVQRRALQWSTVPSQVEPVYATG